MSNLRNRFLALAVVVVMLMAALSSMASAATTTFTDITSIDEVQMVKLLNALQIVLGRPADEDGNAEFDRDTPVTRQEMAMFLARIHSATPGAFNEKIEGKKIAFTDVTDSTFFLAVEYCHDQGIITGTGADTFAPKREVKLDEALAMIVRALGFKDIDTSKNFIESTKKAKELGFALTYKDTDGNKPLTRIEVVSLLYKYFYSDEQSMEIVKNEYTGVQSAVRVPHPVMAKFGIDVQEAYIVRANDYKAAMSPATLENPYGNMINLPAADARDLTAKEQADGKNIIIAYPNFKVIAAAAGAVDDGTNKIVDGYTYSGKWTYIAASKADFAVEDKSDRYLVGLKVVYYQDTMAATRPEPLNITSDMIGKKEAVILDSNDADYKKNEAKINNDSNWTSTKDALTIAGVTYDLSANVNALKNTDIYSFNDTAVLNNKTIANAPGSSNLKLLGRFIQKNGNFGLEYVDNGSGEFYYVFTPYTVGYYEKDDDNKIILENRSKDLPKNHADPSINTKVVNGNTGKDFEIKTGNAYLYTIEGKYLNIFHTMNKKVDNKYLDYRSGNDVRIGGEAIKLDNNNKYIALGATPEGWNKLSVGRTYDGFSLTKDSAVIYIWDKGGKDSVEVSGAKYGVLTQAPAAAADYLQSGRYMWMYRVFTTDAGGRIIDMTSEIRVSEWDYYQTRNLTAGDLVSYQQVGNYYVIGAFDVANGLYASTNGHIRTLGFNDNRWSAGSKDGNITAANPSRMLKYNPFSSDRLEIARFDGTVNTSNLNNGSSTKVESLTGRITSDTTILVSERNSFSNSSTTASGSYARARTWTKAQFDEWYQGYAETAGTSHTAQFEMITETTSDLAVVKVLHIITTKLDDVVRDQYYTITKTNNSAQGDSTYNFAEAWDYMNARTVQIAVSRYETISVGTVVRGEYEVNPAYGYGTYVYSTVLTGPVSRDAIHDYKNTSGTATIDSLSTALKMGQFTQPTNIKKAIENAKSKTIAEVTALLAGNALYGYPIAHLDSGYVASTSQEALLILDSFNIYSVNVEYKKGTETDLDTGLGLNIANTKDGGKGTYYIFDTKAPTAIDLQTILLNGWTVDNVNNTATATGLGSITGGGAGGDYEIAVSTPTLVATYSVNDLLLSNDTRWNALINTYYIAPTAANNCALVDDNTIPLNTQNTMLSAVSNINRGTIITGYDKATVYNLSEVSAPNNQIAASAAARKFNAVHVLNYYGAISKVVPGNPNRFNLITVDLNKGSGTPTVTISMGKDGDTYHDAERIGDVVSDWNNNKTNANVQFYVVTNTPNQGDTSPVVTIIKVFNP